MKHFKRLISKSLKQFLYKPNASSVTHCESVYILLKKLPDMSNCFDKCLTGSLVILKLPTSCSYILYIFLLHFVMQLYSWPVVVSIKQEI